MCRRGRPRRPGPLRRGGTRAGTARTPDARPGRTHRVPRGGDPLQAGRHRTDRDREAILVPSDLERSPVLTRVHADEVVPRSDLGGRGRRPRRRELLARESGPHGRQRGSRHPTLVATPVLQDHTGDPLVEERDQVRRVADHAAGVSEPGSPLDLLGPQAVPVPSVIGVVDGARHQAREAVLGEDPASATVRAVAASEQQTGVGAHVDHGRHDRAIRRVRHDPRGHREWMPQLRRPIGEHRLVPRRVVRPDLVGDRGHRGGHAERAQQSLREQVVDRESGDLLEHRAHDLVAVVRVVESLPRRRRGGVSPKELERASESRGVLGPGVQPCRVREQVVHRDRAEGLGEPEPREQLVHRDVEVEPARVHLLHRHDRRERLRDGSDLEAGLRSHGRGGGDVRHPADRDPEDLRDRDGQGGPGGMRGGEMVLEARADAVERFLESRHPAVSRRRRA